MTEILAGAVVALIGGFFVYLTTGPALGAVRSRRAARELLEIRSALDPTDHESRDAVTAALKKEIQELGRLGDTAHRYETALALVSGGLLVVAALATMAPIFMLEQGQKELMRYICSVALLLALAPVYTLSAFYFGRYPGKGARTTTVIVSLLLLAGLWVGAVAAVQETAYYKELTGL